MGQQERLGAGSWVQEMEVGVVRMVLEVCGMLPEGWSRLITMEEEEEEGRGGEGWETVEDWATDEGEEQEEGWAADDF